MARLLTDGAENGSTNRISAGTVSIVSGAARTGNYNYGVSEGQIGYLYLPSASATLYTRIAIKVTGSPTDATDRQLFMFYSGTTRVASIHVGALGASATLSALIGSSVVATATIAMASAEWHVFECYLYMHASGTFGVKFDGVQKINYSGNTLNGMTTCNRVALGGEFYSGVVNHFDDIAVNDATGGADNSWCGDGGVLAALVPSGAGNYTDLIASAGNAWDCVNEIPQNGDTDYVYESTIDKKSTYTITALSGLPAGASIARVWVEVVAKETAAAGDEIATLLRSATTDSQGTDQSLTLGYLSYLSSEYLLDPADSASWTSGKVNALEIGAVVR